MFRIPFVVGVALSLMSLNSASARLHTSAVVSGALPIERNADDVLAPGALTQLFTSGAALELLGPDFRFETRVEWRTPSALEPGKASDLVILGSGDPSWGMPEWNETELTRFDQIAQILRDQGVREIHGGILLVAAERRWEQTGPAVGWLESDRVSCDGAVPAAFNVQLNCATLVVENPAEFHWKEEAVSIPVRLDIDWGERTLLKPELEGDTFRIRGTWSDHSRNVEVKLPVHEPMAWAERLLVAALEARGIRVLQRSGLALSPGRYVQAPHEAAIHSPPLKALLRPMLKLPGAGLVAESLFVTMGGQSAVRAYLDRYLPGERTVSLWDGSGLSRSNTASARAIHALLKHLASQPDFRFFWDALSVAGIDGSLGGRMRGTAAEGILRAKSAAGAASFALAGYVPRFNGAGEIIEFVPLTVLAQGRRTAAFREQDRLGAELARLTNFH